MTSDQLGLEEENTPTSQGFVGVILNNGKSHLLSTFFTAGMILGPLRVFFNLFSSPVRLVLLLIPTVELWKLGHHVALALRQRSGSAAVYH